MTVARAVMVDLDGTLVDTATANFEAYRDALAEMGVAIDSARFLEVAHGRSWREFLPELLTGSRAGVEPRAVAVRKAELYAERVSGLSVNTPLVQLLRTCRPLCRTALITTASGPSARRILREHSLTDLFDVVVTGDDVDRPKPDPEAYHRAASALAVTPDECVVFEDSDVGVESARRFGAAVLRIQWVR
jgi:beta-phosphoglucomutase